jgi:hypothetical protein
MRKFDCEVFEIWYRFFYKWNNHITVWVNRDWVYAVDLEFDPEFTDERVEFIDFADLEIEFIDNLQEEFDDIIIHTN